MHSARVGKPLLQKYLQEYPYVKKNLNYEFK